MRCLTTKHSCMTHWNLRVQLARGSVVCPMKRRLTAHIYLVNVIFPVSRFRCSRFQVFFFCYGIWWEFWSGGSLRPSFCSPNDTHLCFVATLAFRWDLTDGGNRRNVYRSHLDAKESPSAAGKDAGNLNVQVNRGAVTGKGEAGRGGVAGDTAVRSTEDDTCPSFYSTVVTLPYETVARAVSFTWTWRFPMFSSPRTRRKRTDCRITTGAVQHSRTWLTTQFS